MNELSIKYSLCIEICDGLIHSDFFFEKQKKRHWHPNISQPTTCASFEDIGKHVLFTLYSPFCGPLWHSDYRL